MVDTLVLGTNAKSVRVQVPRRVQVILSHAHYMLYHFIVKRTMGIEPMILPWQGNVLPLNYVRYFRD